MLKLDTFDWVILLALALLGALVYYYNSLPVATARATVFIIKAQASKPTLISRMAKLDEEAHRQAQYLLGAKMGMPAQ